jgi:hypothetical protein
MVCYVGAGLWLDVATNCVSVHGTYIALEPSLDGKEPTAFKAVVLSCDLRFFRNTGLEYPKSFYSHLELGR